MDKQKSRRDFLKTLAISATAIAAGETLIQVTAAVQAEPFPFPLIDVNFRQTLLGRFNFSAGDIVTSGKAKYVVNYVSEDKIVMDLMRTGAEHWAYVTGEVPMPELNDQTPLVRLCSIIGLNSHSSRSLNF